jgi:type IV secretion system protein VirB2
MNLLNHFSTLQIAIANDKAAKAEIDRKALSVLMLLVLVFVAFTPEIAMAEPWDNAANKVLAIFTGGLTRTLAIIAVIACGIAAIAGKLSWDWAIKIIVGIVLIFGSAAIVDYVIAASS